MLRTIYLHDELGDLFIKKFTVEVSSLQEAISALKANFKSFEKFVIDYTPGFHVKVGDIYRDNNTVADPIGSSEDIHIIPAVTGSSGKVGAILAIVVGVVLMFIPGAQVAGVTLIEAGSAMATFVVAVGLGLAMAGISALLFAPPKTKDSDNNTANDPNSSFNGAVNTIKQGYPIPVGYGELIIGSGVISAGISSVNVELAADTSFLLTLSTRDKAKLAKTFGTTPYRVIWATESPTLVDAKLRGTNYGRINRSLPLAPISKSLSSLDMYNLSNVFSSTYILIGVGEASTKADVLYNGRYYGRVDRGTPLVSNPGINNDYFLLFADQYSSG